MHCAIRPVLQPVLYDRVRLVLSDCRSSSSRSSTGTVETIAPTRVCVASSHFSRVLTYFARLQRADESTASLWFFSDTRQFQRGSGAGGMPYGHTKGAAVHDLCDLMTFTALRTSTLLSARSQASGLRARKLAARSAPLLAFRPQSPARRSDGRWARTEAAPACCRAPPGPG